MTTREKIAVLITMWIGAIGLAAVTAIAWLTLTSVEVPTALTAVAVASITALASALHIPSGTRSNDNGTQPQSTPNPPNGVPPGR